MKKSIFLKSTIAAILVLANCLLMLNSCGLLQNPNESASKNSVLATRALIDKHNKVVPAAEADGGKLSDSFRDDRYYYYVYYMGYVANVPLQTNYDTYKYTGMEGSMTFTSTKTSTESVSRQVENLISTNSEWGASQTLGVSVEVEGGCIFADAKMGMSVESGLSFGMSKVESTSTIASNVETYSEDHQMSNTYYFDESCPLGLYRYVLMGVFDLYAIIAYDTETKKFCGETFSVLDSNYITLDYTEAERFNDNSIESFPLDFLPTFDPNNIVVPSRVITGSPEENIPVIDNTPFDLAFNAKNCNADNGFDVSRPTTDPALLKHGDYVLGDYTVYGMSKKGDGYISNPEAGKMSIHFNLKLNPYALNGDGIRVENDGADYVSGTNISGNQTHRGAFWARISFKDGTSQKQIKKLDVLTDKKAGERIALLSADDLLACVDVSQIEKIEISFVYEVSEYLGDNFWGVAKYRYSNWRSDYTFNFVE